MRLLEEAEEEIKARRMDLQVAKWGWGWYNSVAIQGEGE